MTPQRLDSRQLAILISIVAAIVLTVVEGLALVAFTSMDRNDAPAFLLAGVPMATVVAWIGSRRALR